MSPFGESGREVQEDELVGAQGDVVIFLVAAFDFELQFIELLQGIFTHLFDVEGDVCRLYGSVAVGCGIDFYPLGQGESGNGVAVLVERFDREDETQRYGVVDDYIELEVLDLVGDVGSGTFMS